MVIGFTTTCVFSAYHTKDMTKNPAHGKAYSIQQYVIKMVSDLPQVGVFIPVLTVSSTNNHRSVLLSPAEVSKIPYISNAKGNNLFQGKYFVSNLKRFYLKTFNIEIEL
jgi:hypothetical protein